MPDGRPDEHSPWRSVVDTFALHAHQRPGSLAVEAQGVRIDYAEMAKRVDAFAARIAAALQGSDRVVGVCLARDVDLPAWLLAVFKAGGAYLPIDPTTPALRLAQVIDDAAPALIVTSRRYRDVVAALGIPVIVAEDDPVLADSIHPLPTITPDTLAYVLFTSGSTGRPKGVEIAHRSLGAFLDAMAVRPGFAAGEKILGMTRLGFDLSVPDMFLPFHVGGSLALVDLDVMADPDRLAAAFAQYRPHLAQATPSAWRALVENGWAGASDLRILAGGEVVTRALADRLLLRCAEFWNIYGPTETTVFSTACRVGPGDGAIPIGWPIAGTTITIDAGEIMIGGNGVARGYRHRPDLTAARFVVLPDGTRAYRTGDLGRFGAGGALFYLGRMDDQVKIRGFRIELGDVEAAMALDPDIAWSAVRVWDDPAGEPTLVGYAVARPGTVASARTVKAALAARLGDYMIPGRIVMLDVMPLTPNGKVDRAALANPFVAGDTASIPASDASVERQLAAIWSELLGVVDIVGADDFFELGGYSLMTVRLVRRIEAAFGPRLALIDILRHSTLSAMADRIVRGDADPSPPASLLNRPGHRPPLFWLDAGPLMRTVMRALSPDQPAFALNMHPDDEDAMGGGQLSIPAVAARLKAQLIASQPIGPYYLGGWCRWGIVAFELARQLVAEGRPVALLVLLDADRPGRRSGWRARVRQWWHRPASTDDPESFSDRVGQSSRAYPSGCYAGDVLLLRPESDRGDGGWRAVVTGRLLTEYVPGDHLSMVRGAHARTLATALDRQLLAAQHRASAAIAEDQAALAIPA